MSKAFSIIFRSVRVTHRSPLRSFPRPQPPTQSLRIERGFVYLGRTHSLEQKALLWYGWGGNNPPLRLHPLPLILPLNAGLEHRSEVVQM